MSDQGSITSLNSKGKRVFFKRPLSLVFICIYGAAFAAAIAVSAFSAIDLTDFLYGVSIVLAIFCIPLLILFLVLLFLNLKKHRKRTRGFGIGVVVCLTAAILSFALGSLIKDQFLRAQDNFENKRYETAIEYYDYVIDKDYEADIIQSATDYRDKALAEIDKAKTLKSNGDIFFRYELYSRAESEYEKALETYPFLEGIEDDLKKASEMKEKHGENIGELDYVLFKDNIKFNSWTGFPESWGKVKMSDPLLAEFMDIKIEEGSFFEAGREMQVSGVLVGKDEIADCLDSTEGLFVFISAYLVDKNGNIKWSKDGYIKGDSPFIKQGQTKQFSLVSLISGPVEKGDSLYIAAYIKRNLIVLINPVIPESPDGDKNIFAWHTSDI